MGLNQEDENANQHLLGYHVLIAEDDNEMRSLMAISFQRASWKVTVAKNGSELLQRLHHIVGERQSCEFDIIISDIRMPEVNGTKAMSWVSKVPGFPPFILITAFGSECTHEEGRQLGAVDVIDKPFEIEDLIARAELVVSNRTEK